MFQSRLATALRPARVERALGSLGRDVRLAVRMLRKNAVVTAAAVVSLSLAISACVAAFSLVDALILRLLPVRQPEQLVYLTVPTLLAGRTFIRRDIDAERASVVVVNAAFAKRYVGGEPAVGRTLEGRFDDAVARHEIVGVVADTRYDLRKPAAPTLYILLPLRTAGTVHLRVAGDPAALTARLREEVRSASPLFRVTAVRQQSRAVAETFVRERLLALLSGFFAAVGLVLAAVGLYGVLSYSVVRRTREIGIRVALGASQFGVVRMVLAEAGGPALAGAAGGLAGGLYVSRFAKALLFEVTPLDWWSVALPLGPLLLAALLAAVLPARRAARVDPAAALRCE